ncbi:hypothetical protein M5689_019665 [Euphorbia peplus]|nr:hypothetical protein M5689_019665 [Euphorbia peplus]
MRNNVTELLIFRQLCIGIHPPRASNVIGVRWYPPSPGWLKGNTDGSALGCPSPAGSGGIFRTPRGFGRGCFSFPIGNCERKRALIAALAFFD